MALHKILEEDPALHFTRDAQTKEFLLSGSGQLHVETVVEKLKKRYGVEVTLHPPKVPYKETITARAEVQGRHKKQTGGRGTVWRLQGCLRTLAARWWFCFRRQDLRRRRAATVSARDRERHHRGREVRRHRRLSAGGLSKCS